MSSGKRLPGSASASAILVLFAFSLRLLLVLTPGGHIVGTGAFNFTDNRTVAYGYYRVTTASWNTAIGSKTVVNSL